MVQDQTKLPIYALLDTSASMAGEPLEALKQGFRAMVAELANDSQTAQEALLSVIVFDTIAREVLNLTPIDKIEMPYVYAGGVSSLLSAFHLVQECILLDQQKNHRRWRPIIFLFTDGWWLESKETLKKIVNDIDINIIICACGAKVNQETIRDFASEVIMLNNLSIGSFSQYCLWNERV